MPPAQPQRPPEPGDCLLVGRVGAAYGISGWVKLHSFTDPPENILNYREFFTSEGRSLNVIEIDEGRAQGKNLIGHIKGCDDRSRARELTGKDLLISKALLPALEENEFYWHQLEGLRVLTREGDDLGSVDHLLETGVNDVLVVRPDGNSVDDQERLIPYLWRQVIVNVDLEEGVIRVNWQRDY